MKEDLLAHKECKDLVDLLECLVLLGVKEAGACLDPKETKEIQGVLVGQESQAHLG